MNSNAPGMLSQMSKPRPCIWFWKGSFDFQQYRWQIRLLLPPKSRILLEIFELARQIFGLFDHLSTMDHHLKLCQKAVKICSINKIKNLQPISYIWYKIWESHIFWKPSSLIQLGLNYCNIWACFCKRAITNSHIFWILKERRRLISFVMLFTLWKPSTVKYIFS